MDTSILQGKRALVTGASSGLGVDFAQQLAAMGCHLVLVARREDRLNTVAADIRQQYGVEVEVAVLDLAAPEAPERLYDRLEAAGKPVDVLVNNAGFGLYGEFVSLDWDREKNMLDLDIITLVHLTKLFLKDMVARDFGYVLQVASIGAYQPSPLYASYSAAKAFVLSFSEAVNYELRHSKVRVCTTSPGVTRTEFLQVSGQQPTGYQRLAMMESADVVRISLRAMLRGKPSVVPGIFNKLSLIPNRFLPRQAVVAIAHRTMQSN